MKYTETDINNLVDPFIQADKAYTIRMAVQEELYGDHSYAVEQINRIDNPPEDIIALGQVIGKWATNKEVDVGESGTVYRIFQYTAWKQGLNKEFVTKGTLTNRVLHMPGKYDVMNCKNQAELMNLWDKTSQWATAAVLNGDSERIANPPSKLALTYETWDEWHLPETRNWTPRTDSVLSRQAKHFARLLLNNEQVKFEHKEAEDFPYSFITESITLGEAELRYPSLVHHESNRIQEMPLMFNKAVSHKPVDSLDHRIVQSLALFGLLEKIDIEFVHPEAVNKSWPKFWDFWQALKNEIS